MVSGRDTNEFCVGHLLTLVQLEWPSPAAEFVVHNIMQCIRKRGSFCYFPYFGDYIILPDFWKCFYTLQIESPKQLRWNYSHLPHPEVVMGMYSQFITLS